MDADCSGRGVGAAVAQGAPLAKQLACVTHHYIECLPLSDVAKHFPSPVFQSAVKLVVTCCRALQVFLNPDSFNKADFDHVDNLMKGKEGVKGILRQAFFHVGTTRGWRQRSADATSCHSVWPEPQQGQRDVGGGWRLQSRQ